MESNLSLSVSIPFVCGNAVAAAAVHCGMPAEVLSEVGCMLCCLLMAACVLVSSRDRPLLLSLLFFLGLFGYSTFLLGSPASFGIATSGTTISRLRSFIAGIPFKGELTAPLLQALMTGDRTALPQHTIAAFRLSGASHLLALSGLHLGVLAGFMNTVLKVLGNSKAAEAARAAAVLAASAFYTFICGASPSIVRALLFILFSLLSQLLPWRHPEPGGILCTAITLQLAFDPSCITSLAFQMSYLAVAGIVFVNPWIEGMYPTDGRLGKLDPMRRMWNMMSLSLSCQLTTAPLAWLRFGRVPTYFMLTNLLAMPLCEVLMVLGAVTLMACAVTQKAPGMIPEALIHLTDLVADLMLKVLEVIASL